MTARPLVSEDPKKPGYFRVVVDDRIRPTLLGVPGIRWDDDRLDLAIMHRSVLALVDLPDARNAIKPIVDQAILWEARDRNAAFCGIKLRTTQHQAIDFISQRRGTLLGDDMRVGKTLSAVWSHRPSDGPLVVVAPLPTRAVWLGWIRRVFPELEIGVITGKKYDAEILKRPIVFGHYDIIHKWQAVFPIGTLVLDEAHQLSNPNARRTLAAGLLQAQAERVIALTGTPIWNRPANFWSILGLVAPGAWGTYHAFAERYGAPVSTAYGKLYPGLSNEDELRARMSDVMLRRRWVDVADDLPAISRSVVVAEVSQEQQNKLDVLAGKLQSERSNTVGNLAAYRRAVTETKLIVTCLEAEKIITRGESVVVWTWHKDFADRISKKLGSVMAEPFLIHGDIGVVEREDRIAAWKACEEPRILVATMAVAQVGIDLSHARNAIFAEIDYTPAMLGQAEMRTYDPTRPMNVWFVVANHLVDQRIVRALIAKLSASDPLGVAAACDSINALREAIMGPEDHGDLDRLLEDLLASGG